MYICMCVGLSFSVATHFVENVAFKFFEVELARMSLQQTPTHTILSMHYSSEKQLAVYIYMYMYTVHYMYMYMYTYNGKV